MPLIDAIACVVYTDVDGREERPCKFDPDTKTIFISPIPPDEEPLSFLEEEAYVEMPDGSRISMDECTVENLPD